jgi:hypothetical protein
MRKVDCEKYLLSIIDIDCMESRDIGFTSEIVNSYETVHGFVESNV